jgi:hypothetical protein
MRSQGYGDELVKLGFVCGWFFSDIFLNQAS